MTDEQDQGSVPAEHAMSRVRSRWPFAFSRMAPDYSGAPRGLHNGDAEAIPIEDAEAVADDGQATTMRGPRGRFDPGAGQTVRRIPGLPPAQEPGGWGGIDLLPKEARSPIIPPQIERLVDVATKVTTGRLVDQQAGFTWRTIQIDNYSRIWLYVCAAARYVPPYTWGVQFPVLTGANKVQIDAAAPPGFTQTTASSTEVFDVTVIECPLEYSSGTTIPASQAPAPANASAAIPTAFAATAVDQLLLTGVGTYYGHALLETVGGAATVDILDGTDATGTSLAPISLAANQSTRDFYGTPGLKVTKGIFFHVIAGTVRGTVYSRTS